MDYVREELLRQHTVLAQLMTGGSAEEQTPEEEERVLRKSEGIPAETNVRQRPQVKEKGRESLRTQGKYQKKHQRNQQRMEPSEARREAVLEEPFHQEWIRTGASFSASVRNSAREMSWTIQRDARRYDGGFTIY